MKAIVYTQYGAPDVLHLQDVEKPSIKDDEVLIKVFSTTVATGDVRMRRGSRQSLPFWPLSKLAIGLRKPKNTILGLDFAGEVEAVGSAVTAFQPGDQVFGFCGKGAYAQYLTLPEKAALTVKPANMTYEEAAAVPFGAASALFFLRKGNIQRGHKVLIYGASGSVGTAAVQLARYFGAEVTAVCSGANAELVRALGADHVIDYTSEDFTRHGETYDVIFDTLGKTTFSQGRRALKPNGRYIMTVFGFTQLLQMLRTSIFNSQKLICATGEDNRANLEYLKGIIEAGQLKSVIDRCYALEQIVEAHRYVDQGHKKGNVVISVAQAG